MMQWSSVRSSRRTGGASDHPRGIADPEHEAQQLGDCCAYSAAITVSPSSNATPFTEIVDPRPGGRVFEQRFRAGLGDAAPGGRVRLDAIGRWLQDIALADVEDAGYGDAAVWVARRMRICVNRFPQFGDTVTLRTFCSGLGRMWGERRTSLTGETADVETVALWVHLDPDTLRPAPFAPGELDDYTVASGGRQVRARLLHDPPPADAPREPWLFRATDLDLAGHVNNAAYWCLVEERLAGFALQTIDAEIEFRSAAPPGEASVQERGERLWVSDADGELHASMITRLEP